MDVDSNVCHRVFIEAESAEQAIAKFEPMIENQSSSCPCCGDRWSTYDPNEVGIEKYSTNGYPAYVYTHYKDYKGRWEQLYGQFKQLEAPKLITSYGVKQYQGKILFENVEQYAQFLANAYGYSTPDAIIHYDNGDKKEIFKVEIKETA